MTPFAIEHVNITVTDPQATAAWLCDLAGWTIRWQGAAINGGHTVHVGTEGQYLALYAPPKPLKKDGSDDSYTTRGGLNHVGLTVDDIAEAEAKVRQAGFAPHSHADYEPGRRFYFHDQDGVEYEVVSYS